MNEDINIDELLNGYIDGELTQRQQVELKRVMGHDKQLAKRLRELQRCKTLVNSLPPAEAPSHMLKQIKLSLERESIFEEEMLAPSERTGARHLFFRRVLTAAAMLALVSVLGGVIYSILAPVDSTKKAIVARQWQRPIKIVESPPLPATEVSVAEAGAADMRFDGKIKLKTNNLIALDAFINRAIIDNGLLSDTQFDSKKDKTVFFITCSRPDLQLLLDDMKNIWQKCDVTALFVETEQFAGTVKVENVTPEQIIQIASYNTIEKQKKAAKDFASLNNINKLLLKETVFSAMQFEQEIFASVLKPVLTSSDSIPPIQTDTQKNKPKNVHLTIVIEDNK